MLLDTQFGKIEGEDLDRWRSICAVDNAMRRNPNAFSAEETIRHEREEIRFLAEMYERFHPEGFVSSLIVSAYTGVVYSPGD